MLIRRKAKKKKVNGKKSKAKQNTPAGMLGDFLVPVVVL